MKYERNLGPGRCLALQFQEKIGSVYYQKKYGSCFPLTLGGVCENSGQGCSQTMEANCMPAQANDHWRSSTTQNADTASGGHPGSFVSYGGSLYLERSIKIGPNDLQSNRSKTQIQKVHANISSEGTGTCTTLSLSKSCPYFTMGDWLGESLLPSQRWGRCTFSGSFH